jgi:Tfp pilus assembly protein PilF
MSILARLLKKGDDRQEGGEILPGLQQAVKSATASPDKRRRTYLLIAAGAVAAITGGGLLVLYLQTQAPAPQIVRRQSVIAPQPQSQPSSAKAAVAPAPPVATAVVTTAPKAARSSVKKHPVRLAGSGSKKSAAKVPEPVKPKALKPVVKDRASLDAWLFAARTAENKKDYNSAMLQYKKVLEADPQNYRIMNNLASICLNLELYDDALAYVNHALKLKADYVSAMVNGGIAQGRLGNQSGARTMLGRAVIVEPANRQALYNLGLSQERSNMPDDALATWRRLADTGDPNGVLGMARIKERRGENQDALRLYREVTASPDAGQRVKEAARERIGVLDR